MSLGKGLESLIPPQNGNDGAGGVPTPSEPPHPPVVSPVEPPTRLVGHHLHDEDAGPAILSFDFTDSPEVAIPAVAEDVVLGPPQIRGDVRRVRQNVSEDSFTEPTPSDYIFHIEVGKISPNPNQPRRNFEENGLWELAKSIREFGFLQPLVVTRREVEAERGMDVRYELIAGERRLLAAKLLGLEYVPAIVRSVNLEREKLELAIIENVQREDLNPVERARAFQRLQEEFRLTQREIAAKLGKSRETVANTVRLLDLPMYVQEALEKAQITESHGRFLLQINDPAAQKKLFEDIVAQRLTTRDVKIRVQTAKPKKERIPETVSPELKALEEKLTAELGTPVKIEKNSPHGEAGTNIGKIVITFYSEEELRSIVERFGGGEV